MKFSAQEEYGIRCLLALAVRGEGASLTIPEISKIEGLTPSHVAKLLSILRKGGYVNSTRGQAGGYTLAMKPEEIGIKDLMALLGGRLFSSKFCFRHAGLLDRCSHHSDCVLRPLWSSIQAAVDSVIDHLSLADIMNGDIQKATTHLPNLPQPFESNLRILSDSQPVGAQ